MPTPLVLHWSGGKDSYLALRRLQRNPSYDVRLLLSTATADTQRVTMHGVRPALIHAQAEALGLPLRWVQMSAAASNDAYRQAMQHAAEELRAEGLHDHAFGDIFLRELRQFREELLRPAGVGTHFPLWDESTAALREEWLALGASAIAVAVDGSKLSREWAGRSLDAAFFAELPPSVDPCGEYGEFHTLVTGGPGFAAPLPVRLGEAVERRYAFHDAEGCQQEAVFYFQDVLLAEAER